jgi:Ca2+-binding RTX toxin-like protein
LTRTTLGRRSLSLTLALMTMAALFGLATPALANHTNYTLEVTPEVGEESPGGGSLTIKAKITCAAADCDDITPINPVNIDFELEGGSNDADGVTRQTPDRTCDITGVDTPTTTGTNEESECTVTFSGNTVGQDLIRAWIDHDKVQTTTEADVAEGRYAGPSDCQNNEEGCVEGTPVPGNSPTGSQCPAATTPTTEPDCTDVVVVNTTAASVDSLDCDDPTGPDTERETKQSTPGSGNDSVTYICKVLDSGGNPVQGEDVRGENESSVNDPDTPDSASYGSPDYACSTPTNSDGNCTITVSDVEGEFGTASICFYIPSGISPSVEQADCADETTGESQGTDGSDQGNDFADRVELTWLDAGTAERLDCNPETDTNPVGAEHRITCVARDVANAAVAGVVLDMEITGAGDPDQTNSPLIPDQSCVTDNNGSCEFRHTSAAEGTTTYRVWIDSDDDDLTNEADTAEQQSPDDTDDTDVVTKQWLGAPDSVEMTPESDTAQTGQCNPYTITVKDGTEPRSGVIIDVEQAHEDAGNPNQPTVAWCVPSTGPNPSSVDTTRGDLGPNSTASDKENPDNPGTSGGETTNTTDANGQVTIGISVTGNSSNDGSGLVNITAWYEGTDNDDPDTADPKDSSTKTWQAAAGTGGRTIDCEPETATRETGQSHTVTCTVRNASGQPQSGIDVSFTESGPGTFTTSTQGKTNSQGQVSVAVSSDDAGEQSITGTLSNSQQNEPDTDECDRTANDPAGSAAGVCSDTVAVTWEEAETECNDGVDNDGDGETDFPDDPGCSASDDDDETDEPECSDGLDNDGDGDTDFPADEGCDSSSDNDETDPADEKCPGYENAPGNHVVGTEGADVLVGTEDDDIICGLGGDDQIDGLGGNDVITGGSGNDTVDGGDGADDILAQDGDDTVFGNEGNDEIVGGPGDDELSGNGGKDVLLGGGGDDVLKGNAGNDFANGAGGNDRLNGGSGNDNLKGGKGNDAIKGGSGNDTINGGKGKDSCKGGGGKDKIKSCEGASSASRRRYL